MARSYNQRLKPFYLWDYLFESTDSDHTVKAAELIEHLKKKGISSERKSLYSDISLLNEYGDRFGHDVSMGKDGDSHFTMYVNVEVSPQFYGWLCGFGKSVKVLSPDRVVNEFGGYVADEET